MSREFSEWKSDLKLLFDEIAKLPEEEQSRARLYASNLFAERYPADLISKEERDALLENDASTLE